MLVTPFGIFTSFKLKQYSKAHFSILFILFGMVILSKLLQFAKAFSFISFRFVENLTDFIRCLNSSGISKSELFISNSPVSKFREYGSTSFLPQPLKTKSKNAKTKLEKHNILFFIFFISF